MKLKSISSVFVPASAILLQFVLWSSPVARADEPVPNQDEAEYALPADDDLLPETEDGDLRATCPASNKVSIKYCKDPLDGWGTCKLKPGCVDNAATDSECKKDFKAVCGYVPKKWFYE